jgi:cephalosporin hydroxylase
MAYEVRTYFEMGTQFGTSSYVARNALNSLGHSTSSCCISFDVEANLRVLDHPQINYEILNGRIRKKLKEFVSQHREEMARPILFFHDSDHSYENMTFELQFALRNLKADIIVCDDIEGNGAFFDFARKHNLQSILIENSYGPRVGVILLV